MTSDAELLSATLRIDGVVVTVEGELDLATAPTLRVRLDEALSVGTGTVTVDLAGVRFMDARGLTVLVETARRLSETERRLAVRAAPTALRRLFDLMDLTQLLGVQPSPRDGEVPILALTAGTPSTQDLLDTALEVVVTMAQAVVAGADGASITLPRQGTLSTVAASNDVVREMDTDQYESGEGPCVDAALQGERFHITSLDVETRWPEFVPRARARGIRSIMSTPLMNDHTTLGALNIYSRTVDAFAAHEQQWADTFAAGAASVVLRAGRALVAPDLEVQLRRALASREVVALAQGITIARVGGTAAQAHRVLRDVSLRTGQTLLEVCSNVVAGGGRTTSRATSGGGDRAPRAG